MRVLLLGLFDGEDVGEAWVGYQWARRLTERHDITLVCWHKRDRTPISRQLPGVRVIEWREPPLVGKAERLNSMLKPALHSVLRSRQAMDPGTPRRRGEV